MDVEEYLFFGSFEKRERKMSKIYYLEKTKKKEGIHERIVDVAARDKKRKTFEDKIKNDPNFRNRVLRWTKKKPEEYVAEYRKRIAPGGDYIKPASKQMCTRMYSLGTSGERKEKDDKVMVKVKKEDGEEEWMEKKFTCAWDYSHEGPIENLPEDVASIAGFGEAALLVVMKRTLIEKLCCYTYVGDVVLSVNPYMYIPAMVDIAEPPYVKRYELGKDANSYATAHFAYHGALDPELYPGSDQNQSCVVSGESGAGKTVACSFIMKYLTKLSTWQSTHFMERSSISHKVAEGVAKLVGGVSPFLESFGNAKTVMNDNSSRFGKFMKIQFNKGRIVGGEAEHYLLEKGRLSYQGIDERNFHIFYFFLKGATSEERKRLNLKKVEDYPMLMMGKSPIIAHETKSDGTNTYDVDRMNNKLSDDPDDTGCRAALSHAKVSAKEQQNMWTTVAIVLKLGSLVFKNQKVEAGGSGMVDGSVVKNKDLANEISKLMKLDHLSEEDGLSKMLCIYRRIVPGNKIIDSPVNAKQAEDQKNALLKDMYSKMFDEIIKCVNRVLIPTRQPEAFVGILDIFGFEVRVYVSVYGVASRKCNHISMA